VFYARADMVVIGRGKNLRFAFKPSKRLGVYNFSLVPKIFPAHIALRFFGSF
jgi:hypothetical protein